jgi:hypothetical protein
MQTAIAEKMFVAQKTHFRAGRHENKEKNAYTTLVLEFFYQSKFSC